MLDLFCISELLVVAFLLDMAWSLQSLSYRRGIKSGNPTHTRSGRTGDFSHPNQHSYSLLNYTPRIIRRQTALHQISEFRASDQIPLHFLTHISSSPYYRYIHRICLGYGRILLQLLVANFPIRYPPLLSRWKVRQDHRFNLESTTNGHHLLLDKMLHHHMPRLERRAQRIAPLNGISGY